MERETERDRAREKERERETERDRERQRERQRETVLVSRGYVVTECGQTAAAGTAQLQSRIASTQPQALVLTNKHTIQNSFSL